MSDSCSDIFDENMDVEEVDKTEFLNDLFGEPVEGNISQCPTNLQKSIKDNPGCDAVTNPNASSIHPSFASYLPSVVGNGSSLDVKTPSRVYFPFYSEGSDYPSSSLTTPNPNSSEGQTLSTPSSFSPPHHNNLQTPSSKDNTVNPGFYSSTPYRDVNVLNSGSSFGHQVLEQSSSVPVAGAVVPMDLWQSTGSDNSVPHLANRSPITHIPLPSSKYPRSSSYLDQLDLCFDSQLSPAPSPGPGLVTLDLQNNMEMAQVKEEFEVLPATFKLKTIESSPEAVMFTPRVRTFPKKSMQMVKPKKPSLKMWSKKSISWKTVADNVAADRIGKQVSLFKFNLASEATSTVIHKQSAGIHQPISRQPDFKTNMSLFYSSKAKEVCPAVQHGQNTIPLPRNHSPEFWSVELHKDGTEDLFIEKPMKIKSCKRKKVDSQEIVSQKLVSPQFVRQKFFSTEAVSGSKVVKTDFVLPSVLKIMKINPPLVSTKAQNVVIMLNSSVRIVKQDESNEIENKCTSGANIIRSKALPKPKPQCVGCEEFKLKDNENNVGDDDDNMNSLCEDCGAVIKCGPEVFKSPPDAVQDDPCAKVGEVDFMQTEVVDEVYEGDEVGSLIIDADKMSDASQHNSDVEDDKTPSAISVEDPDVCPPVCQYPICWSCKSAKSHGSWHAHKWQEKFLCSSCFNYYKEKNEKKRVKMAVLSKDKESSHQVTRPLAPQNSHDSYLADTSKSSNQSSEVELESDLDPISQALMEMGEGGGLDMEHL